MAVRGQPSGIRGLAPIFQRQQPQGSLGQELGAGLGQGLQALAQQRLQDLAQRQQLGRQDLQRSQFESSLQQLGLPKEIASIPDQKSQLEVIKHFLQRGDEGGISSLLESAISGQPSGISGSQTGSPLDVLKTVESPQELDAVTQPTPRRVREEVVEIPQTEEIPSTRLPVRLPPGARAEQAEDRLESQLEGSDMPALQKEKARDRLEKKNESLRKQQEKINKSTDKYYNEAKEVNRASQSGDMRLDRMEELIKTGKLPTPFAASFLDSLSDVVPIPGTGKSIGLNLKGVLLSSEAQEFDKLSQDFLRDVKKFFGARVTQGEVNRFLATIPNLLQDDEGKLRVIRNIRIFNEINKLRNDTIDRIIEEHGGYRPHNLEALVEKEIKPEVDRLHQEFKSDVRTSVAIARKQNRDRLGVPKFFHNAPEWALRIIGL